MLNACIICKKDTPEKVISKDGKHMSCPFCGHMQSIKRMPLFVITGASGVGKSSTSAQLFINEKDYIVMESDILWKNAFASSENSFREYRELWLRVCKNISQIGKPIVLSGGITPGEFECCLESRYFSQIYYIAIVCDDDILVNRLTTGRNIDNIEWINTSVSFNQLLKSQINISNYNIQLLDNSYLTVDDETRIINDWIYKYLNASIS